MFCPKCGTQNAETARFCRSCGADISLVPTALTGKLPETDDSFNMERGSRRERKLNRPPSLEKGISELAMGVGFIIISICVFLYAPAGGIWWFWMLIPAFASIGRGVAQIARWRHEQSRALTSPVASPNAIPPRARNTGELPLQENKTAYLPQTPPPSVTEGTTRHLDAVGSFQSPTERAKES